jgi:putative transcriptional regulator
VFKKHSAQPRNRIAVASLSRSALLLALVLPAHCQQLASGNLLVATTKSHDPDFARSVVVLIHYDSQSAIGLMLNKSTAVPVSEVLPDANDKSVTLYAGGPVPIGVRGLRRAVSPPFFTVVSNKGDLLKMVSGAVPPSSFRLYAGYTGWTARQLQSEVARGLWKVLPASARSLFDPNPGTLWPRLTLPRPIR